MFNLMQGRGLYIYIQGLILIFIYYDISNDIMLILIYIYICDIQYNISNDTPNIFKYI